MQNRLKPTLNFLRNQVFRCAAACPLGAHVCHCYFVLRAHGAVSLLHEQIDARCSAKRIAGIQSKRPGFH